MKQRFDLTPIPRAKVVFLALRAHTAVVQLTSARASIHEWRCLREAFNMVNALEAMGKRFPGLESGSMQRIHRLLRLMPDESGATIEVDRELIAPLQAMVCAYDSSLERLARRTLGEAMLFIDGCLQRHDRAATHPGGSRIADRPPMLDELTPQGRIS